MNDMILTGTIPGFGGNTANIDGVRIHYLLGGGSRKRGRRLDRRLRSFCSGGAPDEIARYTLAMVK